MTIGLSRFLLVGAVLSKDLNSLVCRGPRFQCGESNLFSRKSNFVEMLWRDDIKLQLDCCWIACCYFLEFEFDYLFELKEP
jgi:hypothetical protein